MPARRAQGALERRPEQQRLPAERVEQRTLRVYYAQPAAPQHARQLPLEAVRRLTEQAPSQQGGLPNEPVRAPQVAEQQRA